MRLRSSTATKFQTAVRAGEALIHRRRGVSSSRAASSSPVACPGGTEAGAGSAPRSGSAAAAGLATLAYELLDAHADTAQLAASLPYDLRWAAHLDYLCALQRKGREALARTAPEELSCFRRAAGASLDVR